MDTWSDGRKILFRQDIKVSGHNAGCYLLQDKNDVLALKTVHGNGSGAEIELTPEIETEIVKAVHVRAAEVWNGLGIK